MTQTPTRCVVAYDKAQGSILAVHFLPPGDLPPFLTEDHFHEVTRSRASARASIPHESIATITADATPFAAGNHLHIDPSTATIIVHNPQNIPAGAAQFAAGSGSNTSDN